MSEQFFPNAQFRFRLTRGQPCPYLPGRRERKAFVPLNRSDAQALHEALTQAGFRRSAAIAYRPACEACQACVPARVPVRRFALTRRWRRLVARNEDLTRTVKPPIATREQYRLLRRYLLARHPEGGMAEMTFQDYVEMVEGNPVRHQVVEYRVPSSTGRGGLKAVALVDPLPDGYSLVYSFFDPREPRRSLGSYVILDHVAQAQDADLRHLYLGFWVPGSKTMDYKADFQPLELLVGLDWLPFETVAGPR